MRHWICDSQDVRAWEEPFAGKGIFDMAQELVPCDRARPRLAASPLVALRIVACPIGLNCIVAVNQHDVLAHSGLWKPY